MLTLCGMSVRLRGLVLGALVGFGLGSCDREEEDPWEPDPQLCTSEDALTLYQRRIEPLLEDANPSTCNQCHLAGIDLGLFAQADECQTMACMVDAGIVDLTSPDDSVVLTWILRAEPDSALITDDVIDAEHDGVREWIRYHASCPDACPTYDDPCGAGPTAGECEIPPSGHDLGPRPFDDPGDCSDHTLELGFSELIYSWRGRCYPCHFSSHDGDPTDAPHWLIDGDCNAASLATMRGVVEAGLVDAENPTDSLLLRKPLAAASGGLEHGGGEKFLDANDPAYVDFRKWVERWAACSD